MAKANKKYIEELELLLAKATKDRRMFHALLTDLLTPAEFDELSIRWQIIKMLANGSSHREITDELGVGLATVARGSRTLLRPDGGFNQAFDKGFAHA
ncbi:transcriptional regulator [Candidatus Uhrbacteria bacterium CG10_big_fil_rev_8_21_14_0_10_48_11]|uniref:Transcriptional regulator n=1 Tax=Candidatus Uhrbacteria bacterium CG10_big_fil_rev_8_21_14_0_10_48_11 TaxID=1975037 RepID=A0A2M8LDN0_9BACT|nr:MAG: transcriptional regulator [Candidatus Uhrbacteria bacterium CG10_big_fil_rev_8_21_14_0_10_48_11]